MIHALFGEDTKVLTKDEELQPKTCIGNRYETQKKLYRQGIKIILAEGILEYLDVKIIFIT